MIVIDYEKLMKQMVRVGIVSVGSALQCLSEAEKIEIVKCKDCKYRCSNGKMCSHPKAIGWDAIEPEDEDFCSYGEKPSLGIEKKKMVDTKEIAHQFLEWCELNGKDKDPFSLLEFLKEEKII